MSDIYEDLAKIIEKHLEPKAKAKNCTNCRHYDHAGHYKGSHYCNNSQENLPDHPLEHSCESFEELICSEECGFYDSGNGTCRNDSKSRVGEVCPFDVHGIMAW